MKRSLLLLCFFAAIFSGCEKEQNRKLLNGYVKYQINSVETVIKDEILLKDNFFECTIKGDTSLYIHATKVHEGVGFIIKLESIKDGTYQLNGSQKGFYENPIDKRIYYTNEVYKGSLTIKKGTFQAQTLLSTLSGSFEFTGTDITTGKTFKLEKGEFLMERKHK